MATLDEFKSTAREELQELRDTKGIFKQVNKARIAITDEEFEQMILDKANYDFDYQNNGYKSARQAAYPSIEDQLDEIFHNGIDSWKAIIQQVKDDNPKPSE